MRHPTHDYSWKGCYFVTICTKNREHFLGKVLNGTVELSAIGEFAREELLAIHSKYPNTFLIEWVIMPNHVHLLLEMRNPTPPRNISGADSSPMPRHGARRDFHPPRQGSLSSIINHFKGNVKRWCNRRDLDHFQWQPSFYDNIIRSSNHLRQVKDYIQNNPQNWGEDRFFR